MIAFYISLTVIGALAIGSIALDKWYVRTHCSTNERGHAVKDSVKE